MSWATNRNHAVWVIQRRSTGRLIAIYDRKSEAEKHVHQDPSTKWTRMQMNHSLDRKFGTRGGVK